MDQDQEPELHPDGGTRGIVRSSPKDRTLRARTRARAACVHGTDRAGN
jgi:hypothetical protein